MYTAKEADRFGFSWGEAYVIRCCEDSRHGWWIEVGHLGSHRHREIRISRKGLKVSIGPLQHYQKTATGWRKKAVEK